MSDQQIVFRTRFTTTWIILLVGVLLIAWDSYARQYGGGTVSEVILTWVRAHPVVPFGLGVLGGHLCWPQMVESNEVNRGIK